MYTGNIVNILSSLKKCLTINPGVTIKGGENNNKNKLILIDATFDFPVHRKAHTPRHSLSSLKISTTP